MSEKITTVETARVVYICDICGDGNVIYSGTMYPTAPPRYVHRCESCGASVELPIRYPEIRYRSPGILTGF